MRRLSLLVLGGRIGTAEQAWLCRGNPKCPGNNIHFGKSEMKVLLHLQNWDFLKKPVLTLSSMKLPLKQNIVFTRCVC